MAVTCNGKTTARWRGTSSRKVSSELIDAAVRFSDASGQIAQGARVPRVAASPSATPALEKLNQANDVSSSSPHVRNTSITGERRSRVVLLGGLQYVETHRWTVRLNDVVIDLHGIRFGVADEPTARTESSDYSRVGCTIERTAAFSRRVAGIPA